MLSRLLCASCVWIGTLAAQSATTYFPFDLTASRRDFLNYVPAYDAQVEADSLAFDQSGTLYFTNSEIRRLLPDGTIEPLKSPPPTELGPSGYRTLTIDPQGNFFFYERGSREVYRMTPSGKIDLWVPATAIPNSSLIWIAAGPQGELYILSLALVQRVAPDRTITVFAGTGTLGFSGDGGLATSAMIFAQGISADTAGTVYLADTGNDRVRAIGLDGVIRTVAGISRPQFVLPTPKGTLYVSGISSPAIYEVNEADHSITRIAGQSYDAAMWGDDIPALDARLAYPGAMAIDKAGSLYFVDNGQFIRRITPDGLLTTIAGCACAQDTVPSTWPSATTPTDVARDGRGNLYYPDGRTHQVRRIGTDGISTVIAGRGMPGFSGDGGLALAARLASPSAIAVDTAGNIYVADEQHNRVRQITPAGVIRTVAGNGDASVLGGPDGVAIDVAGNLYVSDTTGHRVMRVQPDGTLVVVAGTGAVGSGGDGGPATSAQLVNPRKLSIDFDGGVLIADSSAHNIRKIMPDGTIRTLYFNQLGLAAAAVSDGRDGIFVADPGIGSVLHVDATGTVQSLFSAAKVFAPSGLALADDGTLFVIQGGRLTAYTPTNVPPVPLAPAISSFGVANAAARVAGVVSEGEIVSIYGMNMGPATGVTASAVSGAIGTSLAGVRVLVDEIAAPVLYASAGQINAVVPFEVAGRDHVAVRTEWNGLLSNEVKLAVLDVAPSFFGTYLGPLSALNQDNSINGPTRPAARGDVLSFFGTGGGAISPPLLTGEITGAELSLLISTVQVSIGGVNAQVFYAGSAPGFVAGAVQVNVRIPEEAASGDVAIRIGDQTSTGSIYLSH